MKDNYTIEKEIFDTATGITTITINTNYGSFTGSVKLDDIDAQYPSLYHAKELALLKALRKYAKQVIIIIKEKIKTLNSILLQCEWLDNETEYQPWGKATFLIRKEIENLEKDLKKWNDNKELVSNAIVSRITTRDKIVKRYLDKNK